MEQPYGDWIDFLATKLEQNFPPQPVSPKFWYLPPRQHVVETIFANFFFGALLLAAAKIPRPKLDCKKIPLPFIGQLLRTILSICFGVTVVHKVVAKKVTFLFMPCHFVTVFLLYCLYTANYERANYIFNILIHFSFYTILALVFPDFSHFTLIGEGLNFYAHHWVLLVIPIYLLKIGYFTIDRRTSYFTLLAVGYAGFIHFDIQAPAGFISGLNVAYLFWPPPVGRPFSGPFFRFYVAIGIIFLTWFFGTILPFYMTKNILPKTPEKVKNGLANLSSKER